MKIPLSVKPHTPFRGIDDRWWVSCTAKGLTPVDQQPHAWFCGGCGYRLEKQG